MIVQYNPPTNISKPKIIQKGPSLSETKFIKHKNPNTVNNSGAISSMRDIKFSSFRFLILRKFSVIFIFDRGGTNLLY